MEGSAALFQNDMTYTTTIEGTVNGESFTVVGDGSSKAPHGDFNIHAVCTSGKLPFSWKVLSHILQYGYPMFASYPNGLTHFTRECFPEGFVIDRTVLFENDGTMKSHHTYELDGSHVNAHVKVTMEGFSREGAIMKDQLTDIMTSEAHMFPWEHNAVRQMCIMGFPKKDGGLQIGQFDSTFRFTGSRKVKQPAMHFVTTTIRQMKDESDKRDHIVQREVSTAHPAPLIQSAI